MSAGAPRRPHCDFCARPVDAIGEDALLFRSSVGGLPPSICSDCIAGYAAVLDMHKRSPDDLATIVREWEKARRAVAGWSA